MRSSLSLFLLILGITTLQAAEPAKVALEQIRPSKDNTHFVTASGKRFVVWGVNYDRDDAGRLLEDYWEKEWVTVVEDFLEIKALGANTVRIHLQLGKFMDTVDQPNKDNLTRLAKLIKLAEETGLYLDITGLGCYHRKDVPAWYDKLGEAERWDVQEKFWIAVAGACKDSPAIFCYDLMNEPVLAGEKKQNDWLAGDALGGKFYVQRITLDLAGRTREEVAKQWVKKLTTAIRKVDDKTMITVGAIPWNNVFKGAKPLFYAPEVCGPLDFVSVHFYPKKGDVKGSLEALRVYEIGKPLVIEEIFPLGCSLEEAGEFIEESRKHCDGWISFYWGKTIEENEKAGDIKGALIAKWLRYFRSKSAEMVKVSAELPADLKTHPPQRPLPQPRDVVLTKVPTSYVDPLKGNDQNDGSIGKPWKRLQHAVTKTKPGETLYLRGGVYYEKVHLTRSGTAEAPITIAAYPGELTILDGGLREFNDSPATSWDPARDGAAGEYVSTKTYPNVADRKIPHQFLPASWEPMWGIEDQRPLVLGHFADSMVPLHGYRTLEDLRSTNEFQPKDKKSDNVYCGPGMWFNRETNRVHIRLAHTKLAGLGDRAYRGETDPRKLKLIVAAGFGDDVLRIHGIKHVRIEGLVLRGATGSPMIQIYGSERIHLDHVSVHGGFPALLINASKDIRVLHSAFRGNAAPWTGRAHMKYRGTASYQIVLQNGQPVNENIEFANNEFTDDHDFAFLRYAKNLQFHHNFVDNFNDDGIECGPKLRWHTFYFHHNRIGACLGVFQQHEGDKDESPVTHDADSGMYVYRNVFDQRAGVYYTLPKEDDPTGTFLHAEGHLISDHGSPTYPVMRVYHNTFLRREPIFRDYFLFGLGSASLKNTERDVFNNLFVQAERVPGAVILGKEAGALREGGNILWGIKDGPTNKVNPFAKLRASALFKESQKVYEPGWTTNDLVTDPKFTSETDLHLAVGSPAIDAGIPVPAKWPDPLREGDKGKPDIGVIPHGEKPWGVGVDGRIPLFGVPNDKNR